MNVDFHKFLISFTTAVAAAASLTMGTDLFAHEANEKKGRDGASGAGPAYGVIAQYQGPGITGTRPVAQPQLQIASMGKSAADAWTLATRMFNALFQTDAGSATPRPWHDVVIPGKKLDGAGGAGGSLVADGDGDWLIRQLVIKQQPGVVGRDADGRWKIVFNLDLRIERA